MTSTIVSLALLFSPSSVAPVPSAGSERVVQPAVVLLAAARLNPHETEMQWLHANYADTTDDWFGLSISPDLSWLAPTPEPALTDSSTLSPPTTQPESPSTVPLTLRERALNRLTELGAPPWVVGAFDCVGWFESKWQNVRSRTGDDGTLQLNDVHDPELRRLGIDPYVPEQAADFAYLLFNRAGGSFRDWTVKGLCGLR